jgi:uncharacterized protein YunC (DUF1805 family)
MMLKTEIETGSKGRIILVDSITAIAPEDAGAIVVAASHGGRSSGEFALEVPLKAAFFNDAGVGKDNAGITVLGMLEEKGIPSGTVAHMTARIGDSQDMWDNGILSHVNQAARGLGIVPGMALRDALMRLVSG